MNILHLNKTMHVSWAKRTEIKGKDRRKKPKLGRLEGVREAVALRVVDMREAMQLEWEIIL